MVTFDNIRLIVFTLLVWMGLVLLAAGCSPAQKREILEAGAVPLEGAGGAPLEPQSEDPATPTRTVRLDLHATDPEMVILGTGRPQLVEFFAFW
jgi:hypothetical protein